MRNDAEGTGSFVEKVRKGEIPGPTNKKFKRSDWETNATSETGDAEGRDLARAGLFVFEQLEAIRTSLRTVLPEASSSSSKTVQLLIGFANGRLRDVKLATDRILHALTGAVSLELAFLGEFRDEFCGHPITPDEALAQSVNAAAAIVKYFWRLPTPDDPELRRGMEAPAPTRLEEIFRLAHFYARVEELWLECLWTGCKFVWEPEGPVFKRHQTHWARRSAVAECRRLMSRTERSLSVASTARAFARNPALLPIVDLAFELVSTNGVLTPILRMQRLEAGKIPTDTILDAGDQRSYYSDLVKEPLPKLHNLSALELMLSRKVLAALGRALEEQLASIVPSNSEEYLLQCAPVISRQSLGTAVKMVLPKLPDKRIDLLISCFIFAGQNASSHDVWHRPLIDMGGDRLIALVGPLVGANLERDIDDWFSRGSLANKKHSHPTGG